MKKSIKYILILSHFTICSVSALASSMQTKSESVVVVSQENKSTNYSSFESIRAEKNFAVSARAGFLVGLVSGQGLDANFQISPNLQLGVNYGVGKYDLISSSNITSTTLAYAKIAELNVDQLETYARYFVGNTFAITGGLGYRSIKSEVLVKSPNSSNYIHSKANGNAITGKIGIGNYWNWRSGFTLGCEWVGLMSPISSNFSANTEASEDVSSSLSDVKDQNLSLSRTFAKNTTLQLLNLLIGYTF